MRAIGSLGISGVVAALAASGRVGLIVLALLAVAGLVVVLVIATKVDRLVRWVLECDDRTERVRSIRTGHPRRRWRDMPRPRIPVDQEAGSQVEPATRRVGSGSASRGPSARRGAK